MRLFKGFLGLVLYILLGVSLFNILRGHYNPLYEPINDLIITSLVIMVLLILTFVFYEQFKCIYPLPHEIEEKEGAKHTPQPEPINELTGLPKDDLYFFYLPNWRVYMIGRSYDALSESKKLAYKTKTEVTVEKIYAGFGYLENEVMHQLDSFRVKTNYFYKNPTIKFLIETDKKQAYKYFKSIGLKE